MTRKQPYTHVPDLDQAGGKIASRDHLKETEWGVGETCLDQLLWDLHWNLGPGEESVYVTVWTVVVYLPSFAIWEQPGKKWWELTIRLKASSEVDLERHAMNFTPRSVAMGNSMNKAYKLHVKFESGRKKYPQNFQCFNRKGDIFLSAWHIRWSAEGKDRGRVCGNCTWLHNVLTSSFSGASLSAGALLQWQAAAGGRLSNPAPGKSLQWEQDSGW